MHGYVPGPTSRPSRRWLGKGKGRLVAPHYGMPLHGEALGDRIDAATLPEFSNGPCPQCRTRRSGLVAYCPTCRRIGGRHFHMECDCGAKWDVRSVDPHGLLAGDGVLPVSGK